MKRPVIGRHIGYFPGGQMRVWREPVRTTILLECLDKDFEFNRDVRKELRQRWNLEVVQQLIRGYACQTSGNTMRLDFPSKDLTLWLDLLGQVCERSEPPLLRLKRRLAKWR